MPVYNFPRSQTVWICFVWWLCALIYLYTLCVSSNFLYFISFFSYYSLSKISFPETVQNWSSNILEYKNSCPTPWSELPFKSLPFFFWHYPWFLMWRQSVNIPTVWDWLSGSCPPTHSVPYFPVLCHAQWYVKFLRDKGVNSLLEDVHS